MPTSPASTSLDAPSPTSPDANHGTAIASIAAGSRLGILAAPIMNIKVLGRNALGTPCTGGDPTTVDKGLEEALKHLMITKAPRAVVNLSVGWTQQTTDVAMAITKLQAAGAVVVAAAGNENVDAASTVPANLPGVVAVGGITDQNRRFVSPNGGSNFGSTVALWAPGHNVRGADWPATPDPMATALVPGTSFAAPHVAGAVALLWQQEPGLTAPQVVQKLEDRATRNMLTDLGSGSPNALLFVGEDAPKQTATSSIQLAAGDSAVIKAARVSIDGKRLFVAGSGALAYAAFDPMDIPAGPKWTVRQAAPLDLDCADISASELLEPGGQPGASRLVYFGCTGNLAQGRAGDVLDAAVAAWTARRVAQGAARSLPDPPEVFSDGLACAIWA